MKKVEDEAQLVDWGLTEPMWLHTSRVSLSPYDVCVSQMYVATDAVDLSDANSMAGEAVLKATHM